jgi:hypothetical protein
MERLPRMADFSLWVAACETGLGWKPGTFMQTYWRTIEEQVSSAIERSVFGKVLLHFVTSLPQDQDGSSTWDGTLSDLLKDVSVKAADAELKEKAWPATVMMASNALKRIGPALRKQGVGITRYRDKDKARTRKVTLTYIHARGNNNHGETPSEASEASDDNTNTYKNQEVNDFDFGHFADASGHSADALRSFRTPYGHSTEIGASDGKVSNGAASEAVSDTSDASDALFTPTISYAHTHISLPNDSPATDSVLVTQRGIRVTLLAVDKTDDTARVEYKGGHTAWLPLRELSVPPATALKWGIGKR